MPALLSECYESAAHAFATQYEAGLADRSWLALPAAGPCWPQSGGVVQLPCNQWLTESPSWR